MTVQDWFARLKADFEADGLFEGVRRLLVAVSGGPDSVALLYLLLEARRRGWVAAPKIFVGHVHHGLRGPEADEDARYVAALSARLGLEHVEVRGEVRLASARAGLSLEAGARRFRLDCFERWARDLELDAVALAHHADDQAETVLLRASRGTGLRGLGGMAPSRPLAHGLRTRLLRPLLAWRREELRAIGAGFALQPRFDSSNLDRTHRRNLVRHEVLPLLEQAHPEAAVALSRLAHLARTARRDLALLGRRALEEARAPGDTGGVCLSVAALQAWPESVLHETLSLAVEELGGAPLTYRSSRALLQLALCAPGPGRPVARRLQLRRLAGPNIPGTLICERGPGCLRLSLSTGLADPPPPPSALPLPGACLWGTWRISVEPALPGQPDHVLRRPPPGQELVDGDALEGAGALSVRGRRDGDRFRPLGAPGAQPLTEFLRSQRVPCWERNQVPLLVSDQGIVWVVGHRLAESFKVTPGTRRPYVLEARPIP